MPGYRPPAAATAAPGTADGGRPTTPPRTAGLRSRWKPAAGSSSRPTCPPARRSAKREVYAGAQARVARAACGAGHALAAWVAAASVSRLPHRSRRCTDAPQLLLDIDHRRRAANTCGLRAAVSLWTEGRHRCGDPQPVRTCQDSHNARRQWQPTVLHDHKRRTQQPPGDICRAHIAAALASTLDVSAITAYCLSTLNRTMCRNGSVRDVGRHGAAIAMQRCRPRHRRDASDRCISSMTVTSARWAVIAGRWSAAHVQA